MVKKWDKEGILRIVKLLLILFGVMCVLKMYYTYCLRPDLPEYYVFQSIAASEDQISDMDEFSGETVMEQEITVSRKDFNGFQLMFRKKDGGISQPEVNVELFDIQDNVILETWNVDVDSVNEYLFQKFELKETVRKSAGKQYIIRIYSNDMEHIAPAVTNYASYEEGNLQVGNNAQIGSLIFTLNSSVDFIKELYLFFGIIVLCGVFALGILFYKGHKKEENYFLVLGIVWGMLFMLFFPPNTTPDERAHEATAYAKANTILGKEALDSQGNVIVRKTDAAILDVNDISLDTYKYIYDALKDTTDEDRISFARGPLNVPIMAHFPQTIGVAVGWLIHANGMVTLYIGKLFAVLFYLICCYFAIKWIPWGKMVLMVISLFPMSLELAGSFSYDCTVNAISFLFTAYVMKLIYEKKGADWKDYIFLAVLAAWMAPCKVIYVFICALVFAVPKSESMRISSRKNIVGKALVFMVGVLSVLLQRFSAISSMFTAEQGATVAKVGTDGFTLGYIISHPRQSIGMVFNSLFVLDEALVGTTIGRTLGWLQVHVSWIVVFGFILLLCIAVISDYNNRECMSKKMKWLVLCVCFIVISAVAMSMWLDATPFDCTYIEGIQGRYFLPILPILMLTLKNNTIVVKKNINNVLISGIFALEMLTLFDVWQYIVC